MKVPDEHLTDLPMAHGHMNYPGRLGDQIGQILGPTFQIGDVAYHLTVVEQTYDEDTDTTRLGFMYGMPESFERQLREAGIVLPGGQDWDWKTAQRTADAIAKLATAGADA